MKDVVIICRNTEETKVVLGWIFEACPELKAHEEDPERQWSRSVPEIERRWLGTYPWIGLKNQGNRLFFCGAAIFGTSEQLVCPEKHQVLEVLRKMGFEPQGFKAEAPPVSKPGRLRMISLQAERLWKQE